MNYSKFSITLDVHSTLSQVSIPVPQNDTARRLYVSLTDGGKPFYIKDGCRAVLAASKSDGKYIVNDCIIERNQTIRYDFTEQTTAAIGKIDCTIKLYGGNNELLTSPRFTIVVYEGTVQEVILSDNEQTAVDNMFLAEQARVAAEAGRVEAENKRISDEEARKADYIAYKESVDSRVDSMGRVQVSNDEPTDEAVDLWINGENEEEITILTPEDIVPIRKELEELHDQFEKPIQEQVDNYLDRHPEATTTVQDKSLTIDKMVVGTLGYVTPEMYGAKGDGVTDDSNAIRSATNSGYDVMLTGNYLVTQTVSITHNTSVIGNGATIKRADGFEGNLIKMRANSKISGLRIDGNREAMLAPFWSNTIEIATSDNCVVENVTIVNGNEAVIVYGDNVTIRNCCISDCGGNGIHFSGANNVFVEHCRVTNTNLKEGMGHEDGGIIWSDECQFVTCINNYVEGAKCGFGAVDAKSNSNVKLIGNTVVDCAQAFEGIFQSSVPSEIIVAENQFINSVEFRLNKTDTEDIVESNTIISNNIFDNTRVYIENVKNILVSKNKSNKQIYITSCENVIVTDNMIDTIINNSIYVDGSKYVTVSKNIVTGNGDILNLSNSNMGLTVEGNIVRCVAEASDKFAIKAGPGAIVIGNRISMASGEGILVSSNAICTNNTIICASEFLNAIRIYGGVSNAIVKNNLSNGTYSIVKSDTVVTADNLVCSGLEFATV